MSTPPASGASTLERAGWPLVLACATLLSVLWLLSIDRSLTGDEALTIALARAPFGAMIEQVGQDSHVPGYYTLMWLWVRLFGHRLATLRLISLLPALASVILAGRRFSWRLMLLMCSSPYLLHLSVELRMYGLLALCGLLLVLLLREVEASRTRGPLLLLTALCALSVWIHHFAWPGVAASAIILLRRRRFRDCAILLSATLVLYLPWVPMIARQLGRFAPGSDAASSDLVGMAGPLQMLLGIPFSIAGTLLRFSAGTSAFSFDLFSIRELGPWAVPGAVSAVILLAGAAWGLKRAGAPVKALLILMITVALLRPSARHFSLFYPAFALSASIGLPLQGRLRAPVAGCILALSLALCLKFASGTTLPQRCSHDRDFAEAALVAGGEAEARGVPIVAYLDNYSTLALLLHLEDLGYGGVEVLHPHAGIFLQDRFIYLTPGEGTAFLMHDTDSLVGSLASETGGAFVLLANDPGVVGGRPFGDRNRILGRGSDTMSDEDLVEVLEAAGTLSGLPLPSSEGPFSAFLFESSGTSDVPDP